MRPARGSAAATEQAFVKPYETTSFHNATLQNIDTSVTKNHSTDNLYLSNIATRVRMGRSKSSTTKTGGKNVNNALAHGQKSIVGFCTHRLEQTRKKEEIKMGLASQWRKGSVQKCRLGAHSKKKFATRKRQKTMGGGNAAPWCDDPDNPKIC